MKNKSLSAIVGIQEDSYGNLKRVQYILAQVKKYGLIDKSVLEIGCGSGDNISIPLSLCGLSVAGIDIDGDSIEYAKKLRSFKGIANVKFLNIDICEIETNSYETIVCSEVLEHLIEPRLMIKEISRVLKPNGVVIITVPNGYGPYELGQFIAKKYEEEIKPWLKSKNIHKYLSYFMQKLYLGKRNRDLIPGGTLNKDCPHIQNFSFNKLRKLLHEEGFIFTDAIGRTFLSGWLMTEMIERSERLIELNCLLATYLPLFMCSGWLITAMKYR